jgi:yeast amino acid transporter
MDFEKKVAGLSTVQSSSDNTTGEVVVSSDSAYGNTLRGLSPRHVQLMAIGGSIGTGLWVCFATPSPPRAV